MPPMSKLDEVALNIELVLISIIEAAALTFLGENATALLHTPHWLMYIPSILAGLAILLVFWSQAILHAVSFIRWPLRMEHMLLYFVAALVQIIAYGFMADLMQWFLWWTLFSLIAVFIYIADLDIIRTSKASFEKFSGGKAYIDTVEARHLTELKRLVPLALMFNVVALFVTWYWSNLFHNPFLFGGICLLQGLVSLGALFDCVRNFSQRARLLPSFFT